MPITRANDLRDILSNAQVIAVIGHSDKPHRTSYQIGRLLKRLGYTVYPVNPTLRMIDGDPCYPDLSAVPEPIDIVNVFRQSQHLPAIVDEAIGVGARTIWTQLGVVDHEAARAAEAAGLRVVMDQCIKVVYYQVMGQ